MTEKPKKTPEKELECPARYVYDTGIIFECTDNSRVEILGEDVVDLLNELTTKCSKLEKENEQLKQINQELNDELQETMGYLALKSGVEKENEQLKHDATVLIYSNQEYRKENEQLKQELFESEKEYLIETYPDNSVRQNDKIHSLKKEFKERFGRDFE